MTSSDRLATGWARAAAVAALLLLGACSDNGRSADADRGYLTAGAVARSEAANRRIPYDGLDDVLPNARPNGGGPLTDALVVGRVSDVKKGAGFVADEATDPNGHEVGFDDRDVQWKVVELVVDVVDHWGAETGSTVSVGYSINGTADFDRIRGGFLALGDVALPLVRRSPVMSYNPDLWAIAQDGELLLTASKNGDLDLPFMSPAERGPLLRGLPTLARLRSEANKPPHTT